MFHVKHDENHNDKRGLCKDSDFQEDLLGQRKSPRGGIQMVDQGSGITTRPRRQREEPGEWIRHGDRGGGRGCPGSTQGSAADRATSGSRRRVGRGGLRSDRRVPGIRNREVTDNDRHLGPATRNHPPLHNKTTDLYRITPFSARCNGYRPNGLDALPEQSSRAGGEPHTISIPLDANQDNGHQHQAAQTGNALVPGPRHPIMIQPGPLPSLTRPLEASVRY